MTPFAYRPTNPEEIDWEDNWLSNAMAWCSDRFAPKLCKSENHWATVLTLRLFTDCPCCLLLRGVSIGFVGGFISAAIIALTIY